MKRLTYFEGNHWWLRLGGIAFSQLPAVDRLAAYEDTGLEPEEITTERPACVFYCNRKCNLDGDWCPDGPGCLREISPEAAAALLLPPNPPLTLGELQEVDGEPVWSAYYQYAKADDALPPQAGGGGTA